MAVQIQFRRDTAANWTSANPTLAVGELGLETDTKFYKIGDGITAWVSLAYSSLPANAITTTSAATLTNKTLTSPVLSGAAVESFIGVGTGFAGYTFYASTGNAVQWIGTNATANGAVNIAWTSSISLNTQLAVGQSVTVTLAVQNGATAYYPTSVQVDGTTSGVTTKWSGGTSPTGGNANSTDVYTFSCLKTGSASWLVFASVTKFA
jgi:hypothetical protein